MNQLTFALSAVLLSFSSLSAAVIPMTDSIVVSDLTTRNSLNAVDPGSGGAPFAIRSRGNLVGDRFRVASFFQFDVSGISPASAASPAFSAIFSIDFVNRINGNDLAAVLGRNVGGTWSSTAGNDFPLYDWGFNDELETEAAVDRIEFINNVATHPFENGMEIDVTNIVRGWVNNPATNMGFVLYADRNEFQGAGFANPSLSTVPEPGTIAIFALILPIGWFLLRKRDALKSEKECV